MTPPSNFIEPLEPRIAPATLTGQVLTFTDIDGDKVAITFSTGTLAGSMFTFDTGSVDGDNSVRQQLQRVDVSGAAGIDDADITMKVTKAGGGDGRAAVGQINADLHDLGKVTIKGDLGALLCGDGDAATGPALVLLSVFSIGLYGETTQPAAGSNLITVIEGSVSAIKVARDVVDAIILVQNAGDDADGKIGSLFIGGSLVGGRDLEGLVATTGDIGPVTIKRDLVGGAGEKSGRIDCGGNLGPVRIGGDVRGGAGKDSGCIFSTGATAAIRIDGSIIGGGGIGSGAVECDGGVGNVRVGGDVIGGSSASSGRIQAFVTMGDVRIGGSLIGGGSFCGTISSGGSIGHVRIGGDLVGGSVFGSDSAQSSGVISSNGRIASVGIGGSLIAGTDASSASLSKSGAIIANSDIGPVKIGGSILGNSTHAALILAEGQAVKPTAGFDVAIASLTVGGDVRFAKILGGYNLDANPVNGDAAIGAVNVGGNWAASSLVAGARDIGMDGFGVGDVVHSTGNTALVARIASITIRGDVSGSLVAGDNFGFVAEQIDKLKIGARTFTLAPGKSSPADNFLIPFTNDVRLLEVA